MSATFRKFRTFAEQRLNDPVAFCRYMDVCAGILVVNGAFTNI